MRKCLLALFLLVGFACMAVAQYPNIVISTENSPEEPSICINPKNPLNVVAGSNINNYHYSGDGGVTWNSGQLTSPYGVWGDPAIVVDTNGHFYFLHLSMPAGSQFLDRIVCQKSVNGGMTWTDGSFMGLNGDKDQDKEWAVVDRTGNIIYTCWTQFDSYGSTAPGDSSHILFSRSTDGGTSWSSPVRLDTHGGDCLDSDGTVEGAVPAVGVNGEVYVTWAGPLGLVFTSSTDHGLTWPASNCVVGSFPGGWDYNIPGISRANGLPVTCCDLSNSPFRGTIYVNWSDQRNGPDDTDVWLVKSTDGGMSWTAPHRVNNDGPGRHQFFTWMTVDPANGNLWFVFYDRRNHTGEQTDVYLATSSDGGETFKNFRISESPFTPNPNVFFGDYTNIAAVNNIVRPIWARLQDNNLSLMTALVDSTFTGVAPDKEPAVPFALDPSYPNPVIHATTLAYKIYHPSVISLIVQDLCGKTVATIFAGRRVGAGKFVERFIPSAYHLAPGMYVVSLLNGERSVRRKMVID
ncbi:MAG TPA: hypothetical protein PKG48_06860 [Bacteroidales bacterium]|nr:hypothetical protein [Bacteroidales bacterium]